MKQQQRKKKTITLQIMREQHSALTQRRKIGRRMIFFFFIRFVFLNWANFKNWAIVLCEIAIGQSTCVCIAFDRSAATVFNFCRVFCVLLNILLLFPIQDLT